MFDNIVSSIGRFSYRHRKVILILGIVLFALLIYLQSFAVIEYSYAEESLVTDIFPQDDTLVIVYENTDEDKIDYIIKSLNNDEHITSVQAYANTLGTPMSPDDFSDMFGIDKVFINTLFYIYENGMETEGMTLKDFVEFTSSDGFLNNELFSSMIDDESKALILQMKFIVNSISEERAFTSQEIADTFGIDSQTVQSIFYLAQLKNINLQNFTGTVFGTVAGILGMDSATIEKIFKIEPVESMTLDEFVTIVSDISNITPNLIDSEQAKQLETFKNLSNQIKNDSPLSPADLEKLFSSASDNPAFNEDTLNLLYILSRSNTVDMSNSKIALYDFVIFLSENITSNESFSSFLDTDVVSQLEQAKQTMIDGKSQLVGAEHSRIIVTLDYTPESKEINEFYVRLNDTLDLNMRGEYYLVGNTAMSYEVSQTFQSEYLLISLVTAVAIFIVVWFTFRKFSIALLLISVIECAVFAMMSVMAITDMPMYFIALILVQCILMGSMIDYAILFTSYYCEIRKTVSVENALPEVMKKSTYAILTSSSIMIFVTFICGLFMEGAVAAILKTLGIGAFCAILLILFVLPSLLVIFDKFVVKNTRITE